MKTTKTKNCKNQGRKSTKACK